MATAKQGDTVLVHYRGELQDGSVFDESTGKDPLQFTIGSGMLIPDFESAVDGMNEGDSKTIHVEAANAYGLYREDLLISVDRAQFPPNIDPTVGQQLQLTQPDGSPMVVKVSDVSDEAVTLDANHMLAGKDLKFTITLVDIL